MKHSNTKSANWNKFFLGFAIVATISGIYLITQKDYLIGIASTVNGLFLIYLQKFNHTKDKEAEE